ncbi:MAG: ATP-binding cassette domain-containing protein, partial [Eubacteriaceae bacterium]|nr:ATP-binding cassette domain-containing protein [Eubacteriaceae bacterium]
MAVFDIKDLSFTYPAREGRALSGIDLTIQRGEYITLCGRSGCGKTTLLRHLKSVLTPHGKREGEILFEGTPLEKVSL